MQASVLPPGTCVCPADFLPLGMNPLAGEALHAEHCGLRNPLGSIVIIPLTEGGPHSPSLPPPSVTCGETTVRPGLSCPTL